MTGSRETYRTVLIGLGDIAETGHLPALLRHPRFEVVGLCDPDAGRRRRLSELAGGRVETFADVSEVHRRDDIDAVVLALHPEVSVDVAIPFLRKGVAVLDEKPLAVSPEDARRLGDACRHSIYQIGFAFRYSLFASEVKRHLAEVGDPRAFVISISDERLSDARPEYLAKLQKILLHSSVINHEGSHFVDLVRYWKGEGFEFVSAAASATDSDPMLGGPNIWAASLVGNDGAVCQLNIDWLMPELAENRLRITGLRGVLEVSFSTGRGVLLTNGERREVAFPPFAQNWEEQLNQFARSIDCDSEMGATFFDGLAALLVAGTCEKVVHQAMPIPSPQ